MKRILSRLVLLFIVQTFIVGITKAQKQILPSPYFYQLSKGSGVFDLSNSTFIKVSSKKYDKEIRVFKDMLGNFLSIPRLSNTPKKVKTKIEISDLSTNDSFSYYLKITPALISIQAKNGEALSNAFSTLIQLALQSQEGSKCLISSCFIKDKPMYSWRGFMLDESRHFFGAAEVKKILDQMYLFKLNRFHWHLTDEPAWRIEIKKYPYLTQIGAKGNYTDSTASPVYYTQTQIKEIVEYGLSRHIEIIPEIDMPGHATAANKAYPQFSGGGSPKHPDFTFNPGDEQVYTYLTDILREVVQLFPSKMVHLGGDEVSYGNDKWNTDEKIIQLKEHQELANNIDVEHYFLQRMSDSLHLLGAKMLGWDEVVDANLPVSSTIVMWWRHDKEDQLVKALSKGYKVVFCPRIPFYFDFVQTARDHVGRRWNGVFSSNENVFSFNVDSLVENNRRKQILGFQGNIWTETVKTKERLEYMIFPRLVGVSCATWNVDAISFNDYAKGLDKIYSMWDRLGIKYFHITDPDKTKEITDKTNSVQYLDNATPKK